jgi:uncharacterized membrane protein HdeD (DUF308 family)
MSTHENFWIVTVLRGVLAILIGSAILVIPDLARTILFLPVALALIILSLAIYGIADSTLVFITSFFTVLESAKTALRVQSACGIAIGILFCSILFDRIHIEWFLYLIALQALATACAEFMIAHHTARRSNSLWSYVASVIALLCAVSYTVLAARASGNLSERDIALLTYAYLAAFGVAQTLMATRMLSLEHRAALAAHP